MVPCKFVFTPCQTFNLYELFYIVLCCFGVFWCAISFMCIHFVGILLNIFHDLILFLGIR